MDPDYADMLQRHCTIKRSVTTVGGTKDRSIAFQVIASLVPCAKQPISGSPRAGIVGLATAATHKFFLPPSAEIGSSVPVGSPAVRQTDVLADEAGREYAVLHVGVWEDEETGAEHHLEVLAQELAVQDNQDGTAA